MSEKRDAFVNKLKSRIDVWNVEIGKLEARANLVKAEGKVEYAMQIEKLRAQRAEAQQKLDALLHAGEGAWEDLKTGVEKSWEALGQAVKSATTRFK
jgi:hypothetical protein